MIPTPENKNEIKELELKLTRSEFVASENDVIQLLDQALGVTVYQTSFRLLEELGTRLGSVSEESLSTFERIFKNGAIDSKVRGLAALAAAIGYRRNDFPEKSRELLDNLSNLSLDWPNFEAGLVHLRAITYLNGNDEDLERGIALERRALTELADSPGVQHAMAHLLLEHAILGEMATEARVALLSEALEFAQSAVHLENWPKFKFTLARIKLRLATSEGEILQAMNLLKQVQQEESRNTFDSKERRLVYSLEQSVANIKLEALESKKKIRDVQESLVEQLETRISQEGRESQKQAATIVGFMTAALAMIPVTSSFIPKGDVEIDPNYIWLAIAAIASFGLVLFGAVGLGVLLMNRRRKN